MSQVAIRTEGLSRAFGDIQAVDGVSFEVPTGTVFGFLGPNGSGKTTTIRLLLGLLEPDAGSMDVVGFDPVSQGGEVRQRCGALLEHTGLYERMSAEDNLEFYGRVWRLPTAERKARIKELLTDLDLWGRRKEQVGQWSRGMKQKLAVARTLLHKPKLVFLDEPTAGLDPIAAAALREDLSAIASQQGVTVFLTTHNLGEAEKLCHQVGVIREGKLLMVGSPDELRMQQSSPRLEVVGSGFTETVLAAIRLRPEVKQVEKFDHHIVLDLTPGVESTSPLVQFLLSQGVEVDEVRKGKASLEEAFLDLMEDEA